MEHLLRLQPMQDQRSSGCNSAASTCSCGKSNWVWQWLQPIAQTWATCCTTHHRMRSWPHTVGTLRRKDARESQNIQAEPQTVVLLNRAALAGKQHTMQQLQWRQCMHCCVQGHPAGPLAPAPPFYYCCCQQHSCAATLHKVMMNFWLSVLLSLAVCDKPAQSVSPHLYMSTTCRLLR